MNNQERARVAVEALHAGDPVTAVAHATEILGTGADEIRAHLIAGMGMTAAGDWQAGESHLLEALAGELNELKPHALYNLAICYERQGRTDTATALYSAAAAGYRDAGNDAEAAKAHLNTCWMLAYYTKLKEAAPHIEAAGRIVSVCNEKNTVAVIENVQAALQAYLWLQANDLHRAGTLATQVLEFNTDSWSRCLAAYVVGMVVLESQPELARDMYNVGAALLMEAADTRLMNLYVGLRRKL